MSLILEALRKSEAERRRGLAPDVAMELPPTPVSRPRTVTSWLLPGLVVAVLLVLAGWWARHEPALGAVPHAEVGTRQTPPTSANQVPAPLPRIQSQPAVPTLASAPAPSIPPQVTPMPTPTSGLQSQPAPAPLAIADASIAMARPAPLPSTPIQSAQARPPPLPLSAGDISNDTSMLPPVKLSMLIWDEAPTKRFIILNGQRMVEGDRSGDITVIAIERNGVVVESKGAKTRVPLP